MSGPARPRRRAERQVLAGPVVPGDQLRLEVEITRVARSIWKYSGRATVDGQVSAEAELMCTLREIAPPQGGVSSVDPAGG